MPTCKTCLGKKQLYLYGIDLPMVCSRCDGTGEEFIYGIGLQSKFKHLNQELKEMINQAIPNQQKKPRNYTYLLLLVLFVVLVCLMIRGNY